MIFQRIDTGEAAIAELALDSGTVWVVDLKVTLKTIGTVKRLGADCAVVSVCKFVGGGGGGGNVQR